MTFFLLKYEKNSKNYMIYLLSLGIINAYYLFNDFIKIKHYFFIDQGKDLLFNALKFIKR
jgi:hypothetical protein